MKVIPSSIILYLILDDIIDFKIRQDLEKIISAKFELKLTLDISKFRYKFSFITKHPEEFKRNISEYCEQNPNLIIFYEENRYNIIRYFKTFLSFFIFIRNLVFPFNARIFFQIKKDEDPNTIIELIHNKILSPDDQIPEAKLIPYSTRRYKIKIKINAYNEFQEKFKRLSLDTNLDIFVIYESTTIKSFLTIIIGISAIILSIPRLDDLYMIIQKWI